MVSPEQLAGVHTPSMHPWTVGRAISGVWRRGATARGGAPFALTQGVEAPALLAKALLRHMKAHRSKSAPPW